MPPLLATIRNWTSTALPGGGPTGAVPIALHWFDSRRHPNFGDRLNGDLLRLLTGRGIRTASAADATHVCIGSLLEAFLQRRSRPREGGEPLAVWGSGFIAAPGAHPVLRDDALERLSRPVVLHAVRGRLSLERLRIMGADASRTAVGDPGLLARLLVPRTPARRRFRLGLVPHYVDDRDPVFARVHGRVPGTRIIRVATGPAAFLAELNECEVVISSALHGLIAADALGIPNVRARVSDRLTGGDWKFRDYYSAFDVEPRPLSRDELWNLTAADLARVESADRIDEAAVSRVIDGLLAACPFTICAAEAAAAATAAA
ncbi:MAG: polysaccharide pyruvyl transferase family protein [Planctomycetaceae bacterium]